MSYKLSHIAQVLQTGIPAGADGVVEHLLTDSRRLYAPATTLFFALPGPRRDGHQFIAELYKRGLRQFVVSREQDAESFPEAIFLLVPDTLKALQDLAAFHRSQFTIPVIGITGSNGKTIVKEWLYQLLHEDYHIVRSPKSYNSQIGVPLSVWQMNKDHTLAIFEAGISRPGEMEKLERIIRPTIAVLTNIGEAHSEGFENRGQKEAEKRLLFRNAIEPRLLTVLSIDKGAGTTRISAIIDHHDPAPLEIEIPFTDDASIENALTCWKVLRYLELPHEPVARRMKQLHAVNMRLELKKGINHCSLINDSYSTDISSLQMALNFLDQQTGGTKRTVILSDFLQSALPDKELYAQVMQSLARHRVHRLIGIGEKISAALCDLAAPAPEPIAVELYASTDHFLQQFRSSQFREEIILIKGARVFTFERIVQLLEQKSHETLLEINLSALVHNLKEYQQHLAPQTRVMAMVKAFAYGSGGAEIAGILQYHKVDYLGVAYADEGVELRKAGIHLPIMVMNPEPGAYEVITEYNLEPELYSFESLKRFDQYLRQEGLQLYPIHLELETGMNRLGFPVDEVPALVSYLKASPSFRVQSVFSHLAASEDPAEDDFSYGQFQRFRQAAAVLEEGLGYSFLRHIANSAAAIRLPDFQLDMVRLGIGLYGVDSAASGELNLQPVATLKSTVAQIKVLQPGESVSYNRRGQVQRESRIATVRLGYADGYPRRLGHGQGKVWINGRLAPLIGTVCMDMFMVDVTDVPAVSEGDEVILFGALLPVEQLATWAGTIPYEIMTGVSQRVKRVYYQE